MRTFVENILFMKSTKHKIIAVILTFVIVFLMSYIGDSDEQRLFNACFKGIGASVGLLVGYFVWGYLKKNDKTPENFD